MKDTRGNHEQSVYDSGSVCTSSASLTLLSLCVTVAFNSSTHKSRPFHLNMHNTCSATMSSILASAAQVEDPLAEKARLGPWLAAWHDPVAGLTCNGGCMQVMHTQATYCIICGRKTRVSCTSLIASTFIAGFLENISLLLGNCLSFLGKGKLATRKAATIV